MGFIVNRLLVPYVHEAIKLLERGKSDLVYRQSSMNQAFQDFQFPYEDDFKQMVCYLCFVGDATAKDIDVAMKLGCGFPMGPIELIDYTGLDTHKYIIDGKHSNSRLNF